MADIEKMTNKVDNIDKNCVQIGKLLKILAKMHTNSGVDLDQKIKRIEQKLDSIEQKVDMLNVGDPQIDLSEDITDITGEEIYKLKKKYSWTKVVKLTGVSLSTLQYRYRIYKQKNGIE